MGTRRGQALVELAAGLFAVSLVLASLFAFARYIVASLDAQRTVRADAGRRAAGLFGADGSYASARVTLEVEVPSLAGEVVFGSGTATVEEEVHMPVMGLDAVPLAESDP